MSTSPITFQLSRSTSVGYQLNTLTHLSACLFNTTKKSPKEHFERIYRQYLETYTDLKKSLASRILSSESALGKPSFVDEQASLYMTCAKAINRLVKQEIKKNISPRFLLVATEKDINDLSMSYETYKTLCSRAPQPEPLPSSYTLEYDPISKRYAIPKVLSSPLLEAHQHSLSYTQTYYSLKKSLSILRQSPVYKELATTFLSLIKDKYHPKVTRRLHRDKRLKTPLVQRTSLTIIDQRMQLIAKAESRAIRSALSQSLEQLPVNTHLFTDIALENKNPLLAVWAAAHISPETNREQGIEQLAIGALRINNQFKTAHAILIRHLPDNDVRLSAEMTLLKALSNKLHPKQFFDTVATLSPTTSRTAHTYFIKKLLEQAITLNDPNLVLIANAAALQYEVDGNDPLDLDGFKPSFEPYVQGGIRPGMLLGTYKTPQPPATDLGDY